MAVKAYGEKRWVLVQQHVDGRTDVQCRERWVNVLDPRLRADEWTPEEDQRLRDATAKYWPKTDSIPWARVAREFPDRNDNQVQRSASNGPAGV